VNATEFAALKAGDKIENPMAGSFGEVVDRTDTGVNVCWTHAPGKGIRNAASVRHYTFATTAWMHWNLAEPEEAAS
jgi:hypothetical protein